MYGVRLDFVYVRVVMESDQTLKRQVLSIPFELQGPIEYNVVCISSVTFGSFQLNVIDVAVFEST